MGKPKIVFVSSRYGLEVCGGGELHARMLAERLTDCYDVEVLSTTSLASGKGDNFYTDGVQTLNGVTVRRFAALAGYPNWTETQGIDYWRGATLRRKLYTSWFLRPLNKLFPTWRYNLEKELELISNTDTLLYSPELIEYLKENHRQYSVIFTINCIMTNTIFASMVAPGKTILIPLIHKEMYRYFSSAAMTVKSVACLAFNTTEEKRFFTKVYGNKLPLNSIVAVSIELPDGVPAEDVIKKYNLPQNYILYLGRIHKLKITNLLSDFIKYKQQTDDDVKLVMAGSFDCDRDLLPASDDIIYTGFITDQEKISLISNSLLLVNASRLESLSLLMLEGMAMGKAVLVNGDCSVLKAHCKDSGCNKMYYNRRNFIERLSMLISDEELREEYGRKGREYFERNYSWEKVMARLHKVIDTVIERNK